MNLGPYTGDPNKAISYLFGKHFQEKKGYKAIPGNSKYDHRFGGNDWDLPICPNCGIQSHQIFTFDLRDPKLQNLDMSNNVELPLISCLNCSSSWGKQLYKIDFNTRSVESLDISDNQHWIQNDEDKLPVPLPRYNVILHDLHSEDCPVDEESYDIITSSIGKDYICRVLGAPVFLQSPIDIECPICENDMIYIGAIYSQLYGSEPIFPNVNFFLGEMSLYYFFCPNCNIMKVECQGT